MSAGVRKQVQNHKGFFSAVHNQILWTIRQFKRAAKSTVFMRSVAVKIRFSPWAEEVFHAQILPYFTRQGAIGRKVALIYRKYTGSKSFLNDPLL